jgi:hypothetical protein
MKGTQTTKRTAALLAAALIVVLMFTTYGPVHAQGPTEYERFVHTYINNGKVGNMTCLDKPMFPVYFNTSTIAVGAKWTITCPLVAGHSYHVYCFGDWVDNSTGEKTDYNINVYNPRGQLESSHTSAAGLPEHLGTAVNDTFFVPATTGNYTYTIVNNEGRSQAAQEATFMIIEDVPIDKWFTTQMAGRKPDGSPALYTTWACEFYTDQPQIQVQVDVPPSLTMYEAKLYAMSNPESLFLNDVPLPWEPGLYGNLTSGNVGGYLPDSDVYRGVAYATGEHAGQDMTVNYNSTTKGLTLYHLVLIGEAGSGNVNFLIKTQFKPPTFTQTSIAGRVYPWNTTTITYATNATNLESATLTYTTNHWLTTQSVTMTLQNKTCTASVPPQKTGTNVEYRVTANDTLMNWLEAAGNFTVKLPSTLNVTLPADVVRAGDEVVVSGKVTGVNDTTVVTLTLFSSNETATMDYLTEEDGVFTAAFIANTTGTWGVQAQFLGNTYMYPSNCGMLRLEVEEPSFYAKNGLFVGGGFLGAVAILAAVAYMRKRRSS